ncbi:hypothetical protein Adt_17670 [Abeliophyllum distichum]|uniref:Uncharacterized protein n=1 Tax=Abeliophyllum distichum TaxID=126358 RepID=A0ABD1TH62_9LAMI
MQYLIVNKFFIPTYNLQARRYYAEDRNGLSFKYDNLWEIVRNARKFQEPPLGYETHDVQMPLQSPIKLDEDGGETFGSVRNPMQYEKPIGRKTAKQAKRDKNAESSNSQSRIANSRIFIYVELMRLKVW